MDKINSDIMELPEEPPVKNQDLPQQTSKTIQDKRISR